MRPLRPLLLAATLGLAAACGDTDSGSSSPPPTEDTEATIVAENVAFDTDSIDARVGTLAITFENRDEGVTHNLHVRGVDGDPKTEIVAGPVTQPLEVTFDEEGEYAYVCDVHPDTMQGTITVTG